jgi:hypothetical protein
MIDLRSIAMPQAYRVAEVIWNDVLLSPVRLDLRPCATARGTRGARSSAGR